MIPAAKTDRSLNPILKTGLLIGVLCAIWMFVVGVAGWYRDPAMSRLFFFVIVIEAQCLFWGLRQTAREGRTYSGQIVAGTMMAIVGGVVIIAASLVFTSVFRDAMDVMRSRDPVVTPMSAALNGFVGTLVTGIVFSALIALRVRGAGALIQ